MASETKTCQNCKQDFIIEPEDFNFYEKIKVPPPTFCPECRLQRKLAWRNERTLYKRKCDAPGHSEELISMYPPDAKLTVYDRKYYEGDGWDARNYARDYDFSTPFFKQWIQLFFTVPTSNLIYTNNVNSEYLNFCYDSKNCYLNFASDINEDAGYLYHSIENKWCFDLLGSRKCENSYELIDCDRCYGSEHSTICEDCINIKYCYDCRSCQNCIGCTGLRNQKFCILNKQYSEEDYKKEIATLDSADGRKKFERKFQELLLNYPRKYSNSRQAVNSTGDYLKHVKNCGNSFDIEGPAEDSRYIIYGVPGIRNVYDMFGGGVGVENGYDVINVGIHDFNIFFSGTIWESMDITYSYFLDNCKNCFGCVGLKNKQYCILNKQYTKEEYEMLVQKIKKHMADMPYFDKNGVEYKFGEFFPAELSPFAYNESMAQQYFPLTKRGVIKIGYGWKDTETRNYKIDINNTDIPKNVSGADDSIIGKVIECLHKEQCHEQCTKAFKIIKSELDFYRKMKLPLPRLCPNCRHYERLQKRNPMKLWYRSCMCDKKHLHHEGKCEVEFETSYSPDRPEIIYCEKCYQAEVY